MDPVRRMMRSALASLRSARERLRQFVREPDPVQIPLWTTGPAPTAAERERLRHAGVDPDELAGLDLRRILGPWPEGWSASGGALYVSADLPVPTTVIEQLVGSTAVDALVCLSSRVDDLAYLIVAGTRPTVYIGRGCLLPNGEIHCAGAELVLSETVTAVWHPTIDARNGGSIVVRRDQLWASDVILATDDMHRIAEVSTGARVNPRGGRIRIAEHVWLGREAFIMGGTDIGAECVIGARSMVRRLRVEANSVVGGAPARVIRTGVTWSRDDLP